MLLPSRNLYQLNRRPNRRVWTMLGTAALLAVLLSGLWVWRQLQPVNRHDSHPQYVKVQSGQSASSIARVLQKRGLIRSALVFRILSRTSHLSRSLESGVYRIRPSETPQQILQAMRTGEVVTIRVTIPEGYTVQQIITRLVAAHIGSSPATYLSLLQHPLPGMPAPAPGVRDPYEGYLFPATYKFAYGTTPAQALAIMWQTFERKVEPLYSKDRTSLSFVQWVTLASIVQREDKEPQEASGIAGVFVNRLVAGMPLQSDATVRYALDNSIRGPLTYTNLTVVSPYNTYLHKGLPPGPIANPGIVALKAALDPKAEPYLYFLALPDGRVLYATTYAQQLANIAYVNQHP
ncbi:endolytic transglycosylase MltG [Sulfobacillus sp. hq2]|uniref:endolytic transglycosylase MltG n=1 Tax=Sulfobacillus sp. hq2 TaxID=2039167 RepID=UPI001FA82764|nr:endolytic transglycosylase MltG [Sulfobacillus sp. hq2]